MSKGLLQAFRPQPIVELKKQDKSKIETLLAYGDRLLLGLNTGDLRIYRVNEDIRHGNDINDNEEDASSVRNEKPVELRREVEKFSRKPIQQLAVIKEANVLVSLSDGYVSFHDLQTFELSERLEITKGATAFATISNVVKDENTDMMTIESHLAVAVKRKVLLWSWQDMELVGAPSELTLAAPVKSLAWMNRTRIVAGMDPGFVLINIDDQDSKDIYRPAVTGEAANEQGTRFGAINSSGMGYMGMGSWVPKPMMSKLANDEMLLAKDVNTLFISKDGDALDKRQIPWAAAPEAVGYSYPYVLCLQPRNNGTLETRNPDTMTLLQSINLPGINCLHVPQPNISLAHAGKGFLVSNERCIWRMNAIGYDPQMQDLTDKGYYDEAVSLLSLLEDTLIDDKEAKIRHVKKQKALHLFHQQKYQEAMDLFSKASAAPQEVIALFPSSVAGSLSSVVQDDSNPKREAQTPQKLRPSPKKHARQPSTPPKKTASKDADTASVKSAVKTSSDSEDVGSSGHLEGKDLKRAVIELLSFLVQSRTSIQRFLNFDGSLKETESQSLPDVHTPPFGHLVPEQPSEHPDWRQALVDTAAVVDTTLFRSYMFARPVMATSLFRLDNFCDPQVVEEKLYESKRYLDLINFLHGKKLHREALELLEKLGKDEAEDVDEALRGPQRMIQYLQQLPPEQIELILQYAKWPVEQDAQAGLEIFTNDSDNAENLPRDEVLTFLKTFNRRLPVEYLEHVVDEWHDVTPALHDALIDLYLEELKSRRHGQTELPHGNLKKRMESLLSTSTQYDTRRVLSVLPTDDETFYEARAILHGRLNEHLKALQLYVFSLHDPQKAELYCNTVYAKQRTAQPDKLQDPDTSRSIYTTLLTLYLDPPTPHQRDLDSAIDLLSRHGSRLPALTTLDFLPLDLSIAKLEAYFRGRMRAANTLAHEQAIIRSLSAVSKASTDIDLHIGEEGYDEKGRFIKGDDLRRGQGRRVELTDERMCAACHKRFGRAAVRIWPNGEVRHYGCGEIRRLGEARTTALPQR